MENNNNEMWVDEKIRLILHEDIMHVTTIGNIDIETAKKTKILFLKLTEKVTTQLYVMVDLNKAGKDTPEVRNVWKELRVKNSFIALYGLNPVARVLAFFFMQLTNNKKTNFFSTEESALEWIQELKKTSQGIINKELIKA